MVGVTLIGRCLLSRPERDRSRPAGAVIQTGHEERAIERFRLVLAFLRLDDTLEVVDAVLRGNQRIGRAVVVNQLMAECAERIEVGIGGVGDRSELRLGAVDVLIEVERRNGQSAL